MKRLMCWLFGHSNVGTLYLLTGEPVVTCLRCRQSSFPRSMTVFSGGEQ